MGLERPLRRTSPDRHRRADCLRPGIPGDSGDVRERQFGRGAVHPDLHRAGWKYDGHGSAEYLLLVNGRDDNQDGYIDDGWDGVDNNNNGLIDEAAEWETEVWPPALAAGVTAASYQIRRRPVPIAGGAVVALPSSVVIDLTSAGVTNERSRLPVNPWTGGVDLLIFPDGTATVDLPYGVPSSLSMGAAFYHFWMAERSDVQDMPQPALPTACQLSCPPPGNVRIVTLSKSGRLTVYQPELFDPTNPGAPFQSIQQGGR